MTILHTHGEPLFPDQARSVLEHANNYQHIVDVSTDYFRVIDCCEASFVPL